MYQFKRSITDDWFQPKFTYKYGREDCATSPLTSVLNAFPSGHLNHAGVMDFFATQFKLDKIEAVALMGAHALGKSLGASGFIGIWAGSKGLCSKLLDVTKCTQVEMAF